MYQFLRGFHLAPRLAFFCLFPALFSLHSPFHFPGTKGPLDPLIAGDNTSQALAFQLHLL